MWKLDLVQARTIYIRRSGMPYARRGLVGQHVFARRQKTITRRVQILFTVKGNALQFPFVDDDDAPARLLRVCKESTHILRDAGNGQPKPHTEYCFDLSVEENTRMQMGEPRVCMKPAREIRAREAGLPCQTRVRWLPIENGTGAISCQWHGEIPFSDTLLSQTVPPERK